MPNPRFNSDVPRQFSAGLSFAAHLSLVAKSPLIRTPVKRNVVIQPHQLTHPMGMTKRNLLQHQTYRYGSTNNPDHSQNK